MTRAVVLPITDDLAEEWERLATTCGANPFATPWWIRAWWECFGQSTERISAVVARNRSELVAVMPLRQRRASLAYPANHHTPTVSVSALGHSELASLFDALLGGRRAVSLPLVDVGSSLHLALVNAARRRGWRVLYTARHLSPVLPLVLVEHPLDPLSASRRSKLRRARRRLEAEGTLRTVIATDVSGLDPLLDEAFHVEGCQWKGAAGTAMASQPRVERFYRRVAHEAALRGLMRLIQVRLDGRLVSFSLGMLGNRSHFILKSGFLPGYAECSPGHLAVAGVVAGSLQEGLDRVEFLGAPEAHKRAWTAETRERVDLALLPPLPWGALADVDQRLIRPALRRVSGPSSVYRPGEKPDASRLDRVLVTSPLQSLWRTRADRRLAVLGYHAIIDPRAFALQLDYLAENARPIDFEYAEAILLAGEPVEPRSVLITFDDADRSVLEHALPEMRRRGLTGVVFVVGGLVDTDRPHWWQEAADLVDLGGVCEQVHPSTAQRVTEALKLLPNNDRLAAIEELKRSAGRGARPVSQLTSAELRDLDSGGLRIENHTLTHPCLTRCDDETVGKEIRLCAEAIAEAIGREPTWLAYPNGDVDRRIAEIARSCGVRVGLAYDNTLARRGPMGRFAVSRLAVDAEMSVDRLRLVLSGLVPDLLSARDRLGQLVRRRAGVLGRLADG